MKILILLTLILASCSSPKVAEKKTSLDHKCPNLNFDCHTTKYLGHPNEANKIKMKSSLENNVIQQLKSGDRPKGLTKDRGELLKLRNQLKGACEVNKKGRRCLYFKMVQEVLHIKK